MRKIAMRNLLENWIFLYFWEMCPKFYFLTVPFLTHKQQFEISFARHKNFLRAEHSRDNFMLRVSEKKTTKNQVKYLLTFTTLFLPLQVGTAARSEKSVSNVNNELDVLL
jgi:hypothetical protein